MLSRKAWQIQTQNAKSPSPSTANLPDVLCNPSLAFALWWLPGIALVATASLGFGAGWRTVVWTAALSIMATACFVNAVRCGRVHCYMTGPFFLAMAVVTLLYGLGLVPLGRNGWNLIGLTILLGAIALYWLPELLFGKYRKNRSGDVCDS